jgi:gluconate 5-dehydrogenase
MPRTTTNPFSLEGKVALVTGASRGLGYAMARALAEAGAHVVLNSRDQAALDAKVALLQADQLSAQAIAADASLESEVVSLVKAVVAQHGKLDIVIANAGIQHRAPITDFATEDYLRVVQINQHGPWFLAREAARVMVPRKQGRIIFTGSISAILGRAPISAYVASKGALHALTRTLAADLGRHGITVNSIAPGYILTEMNTALANDAAFDAMVKSGTPVGRWGAPEDIGNSAVYLASAAGAFVNGHILTVDGGFSTTM